MKMSNTNKTLILTIVLTLAVSLFFGAIVYAFNDRIDFGDNKEQKQMMEDRGDQQDGQRGSKDQQGNSNRDNGPDSGENFGFKDRSDSDDRPDFDRDDNDSDKETASIGELKSIDGTNVVISVKSRGKNRDSQDQSEDKTYTVASNIDLASFAVGDTVKYEADDNNQITSMEKFELKQKQQDQNNKPSDDSDQQNNKSRDNSEQQNNQKQTSFSQSV